MTVPHAASARSELDDLLLGRAVTLKDIRATQKEGIKHVGSLIGALAILPVSESELLPDDSAVVSPYNPIFPSARLYQADDAAAEPALRTAFDVNEWLRPALATINSRRIAATLRDVPTEREKLVLWRYWVGQIPALDIRDSADLPVFAPPDPRDVYDVVIRDAKMMSSMFMYAPSRLEFAVLVDRFVAAFDSARVSLEASYWGDSLRNRMDSAPVTWVNSGLALRQRLAAIVEK